VGRWPSLILSTRARVSTFCGLVLVFIGEAKGPRTPPIESLRQLQRVTLYPHPGAGVVPVRRNPVESAIRSIPSYRHSTEEYRQDRHSVHRPLCRPSLHCRPGRIHDGSGAHPHRARTTIDIPGSTRGIQKEDPTLAEVLKSIGSVSSGISSWRVRPITPRRSAKVSHANVISEDDEQAGFLGMGGSGREGQFRN
jgi:hypothetical protein